MQIISCFGVWLSSVLSWSLILMNPVVFFLSFFLLGASVQFACKCGMRWFVISCISPPHFCLLCLFSPRGLFTYTRRRLDMRCAKITRMKRRLTNNSSRFQSRSSSKAICSRLYIPLLLLLLFPFLLSHYCFYSRYSNINHLHLYM